MLIVCKKVSKKAIVINGERLEKLTFPTEFRPWRFAVLEG
jgi:hypothetical protein